MNTFQRAVELSCLASWLCLAACGSGALPVRSSDKPRVAEWKPGDELTNTSQALTIRFDRDMVSSEAVGPVLEQPPVAVQPQTPLRVHWDDRRTLVVAPETEWKAGRRYELLLSDRGAPFAELAEPRKHRFDVEPLRLSTLTLPTHNAPRTPDFDAYFSQPVDPKQAEARCVVRSDAGKITQLRLAQEQRPRALVPHRVHFVTTAELEQKTHYVFVCPELLPVGGDAPFREAGKRERRVGFKTHGPFEFTQGWPEPQPALPPERAELCIELSTPVDREQLMQHVHVSPTPEGLEEGWYQGSCRPRAENDDDDDSDDDSDTNEPSEEELSDGHHKNSILLAPRRHYRVTLDADLSDAFGQKLGKTATFEFDTSDRIPGLWTLTGLGPVLERGRREHSAGTLNLATVQL
ncbi:MAG: hypothetical protein RL701_2990, partial [Pseudomonadota bacterium]